MKTTITKYRLLAYELLGNEEEGFEVNDVYDTGIRLEFGESALDEEILQAVTDKDYVEIDQNCCGGESIEFIDNRNGSPLGRLEKIHHSE